jgi:hypothetical protein
LLHPSPRLLGFSLNRVYYVRKYVSSPPIFPNGFSIEHTIVMALILALFVIRNAVLIEKYTNIGTLILFTTI